MLEGVDYSATASASSPSVAALQAAGKRFVGRYAVNDKSPGGRGITRAEYARMVDGGIGVFLYWQTTTSWMLDGYDAGVRGAANAHANILGAGMPVDTPVYFACDFDAAPYQMPAIQECLRGAASIIGLERVGVYGGWSVIEGCYEAQTATWFCQTVAWSGDGQGGTRWHPAAHLHQYDTHGNDIDGTDVDLVRATVANYGQAIPAPPPKPIPPKPTIGWVRGAVGLIAYKGVAVLAMVAPAVVRDDTVVRYAASGEAKAFKRLVKGTEVVVLGTMDSGWGMIDAGDGAFPRIWLSRLNVRLPKPADYTR